jgi:hypothetical protein
MAFDLTAASSQSLSTSTSPITGPPLTIACWMRPKDFSSRVIASIGTGSERAQLQITNSTTFNFNVVDRGGNATFTRGSAASANTWYHYAGTIAGAANGSLFYAYFDGVQSPAGTVANGPIGTMTRIIIGGRDGGGSIGLFANALVAEAAVWSVVLGGDEIASLAKGMTCDKVRPQSLVFYGPLVRDLQDVRGGLTITNNNTATVANHTRVYA